MTSNEWEKRILEEDRKIRKNINKYRTRSSRRVIEGLIVAFFGFDSFNDVIKNLNKIVGEYAKTVNNKSLSLETIAGGFHAVAKGIDGRLALVSLVLLMFAFVIFMWAISTRNKADLLDTKMYKWTPDEAEIADIRKRFDNDFVREVLSKISSSETESVTVSLEGILIDNNEGNVSYNFNKEGFKRLTNYESKQLAYFIGSEAFPEGFIIHQLKKHASAYGNYARGYFEVGETREKAPNEEELTKKNVRWLLKEIGKLTKNKKLIPKEEPVKAIEVEGGHIVLNKGYSENSEKYKTLE